jgi:hypothetical protein
LRDAFEKSGFHDGNSNRNYTGDAAGAIDKLGYEVDCGGWGSHNYVIGEITRIEAKKGKGNRKVADDQAQPST